MTGWQSALTDEWRRRRAADVKTADFPLIEQNFEADEIVEMAEVILSGQLTMGPRVREFEKKFAAFVGAPYAVMVNSGSSANLLAVAAAANPARPHRLNRGDEILVPAVCWSTSIWPIVQMGLTPVLVDVDPLTLNLDPVSMREKTNSRTKGLMAVHVLGNCAPMDEIQAFAKERGLIIVEDTCESLGSRWNGKTLGTLGDFGTFSFYFSHHMTTGEGGMVVCRSLEDYDLLKCLRAHGWSRELSNRSELEKDHADVDGRFLFVNAGFNFRPMEIQAALGLRQIEKLPIMNRERVTNWSALVGALRSHPRWRGQFEFPKAEPGAEPVWFGFPAFLSDRVNIPLKTYLEGLSARGVENRPIVSGNFARQPGLKLFGCEADPAALAGAEKVHQRGFFIGSHTRPLSAEALQDLAGRLLYIDGS